jgi:hypothetical protein
LRGTELSFYRSHQFEVAGSHRFACALEVQPAVVEENGT